MSAARHETPSPIMPDPALLRAFWQAVVRSGDVHEVRIPKSRKGPRRFFGVISGYFNDVDAFVSTLSGISGADAEGVYLTLNPVNPALLARSANRLNDSTGKPITTTDADIARRRHVLIDVDPGQPTGISATEAERAAALTMRDRILTYLTEEETWPPPTAVMETGNGGALLYRVRLVNDAESLQLVDRVLKGLAAAFNDGPVHVDTGNVNAARIGKVIGTVSAKGDSLVDRPWRLATARFYEGVMPVSPAQLAAVGQLAPTPEPRRRSTTAGTGSQERTWEIDDELTRAGVGFTVVDKIGYRVYKLDRCLTSADHVDGAAILEFPSRALAYRCHHNRCVDKGWAEAREALGIERKGAGGGTFTVGGQERPGGETRTRTEPKARAAEYASPPAAAYYGWVRDYVDLMLPTTEAPECYHLGVGLSLVGALIGRRAWTYYGRRTFANLFIVLIGPTGRARKDTAMGRQEELLELPIPHGTPLTEEFWRRSDVTSAEGLIGMLAERPNTMLAITELSVPLRRARRQSTGTLLTYLIKGFDAPRALDHPSLTNPLVAKEPYLSILAATTPETLAEDMTEAEIVSGFANRFLYFCGEATGALAAPPKIDVDRAQGVIAAIRRQVASFGEGREVLLTPHARARWERWYIHEFYPRDYTNELHRHMVQRYGTNIHKIALIFAVSEGATAITEDHIEAAIALVEWSGAEVLRQIDTWGQTQDAKLEDRVVYLLRTKGPLPRRVLQQRIGRKLGSGVFVRVLEAMVKAGKAVEQDGLVQLVVGEGDDG